jgi:Trk K+ transport system NAD-binding subunit
MAGVTGSHRVTYIVLRFMRRPILVLVTVYAISMLGWVLIPGADPEHPSQPMSFFHALYFLTYTATTTGFGEIPHAFTDTQRMWVIVSLYSGVVAWLYAVGAIIQLIQNPHFRQAIAEVRFAKSVARLNEPFVILCGFGSTGSLLTRGLSDSNITAVILDNDPDRVVALFLRDYRVAMHALQADARVPDRLIEAGLMMPNCEAVVALTADEELNVKIAVTARLLNPKARVIALSTHDVYDETLSTLGGEVHIIDPFHTYARYLGATIHNPLIHMLNEWLIGAPGANLAMYPDIPTGTWILCGFGRLGQEIQHSLVALGIPTIVIDPTIDPELAEEGRMIAGRATQQTLLAAGIQQAAGIVIGTNSDPDNLSILLNAKKLNPDIFVLVRQNRHRNQMLFSAAEADLIMQPSLVSARRILFLLIAPLLRTFFERVRDRPLQARDEFLRGAINQLQEHVGGTRPRLWTVEVREGTTAALMKLFQSNVRVSLGEILRNPSDREQRLPCVPLVLRSGDDVQVMPDLTLTLKPDDQVLFCGRQSAHHLLDATLNNEYTLQYLMTGIDEPRGYVMQWAAKRLLPVHQRLRG